MTLEIRITTTDPGVYGPEKDQINAAMEALGFVRQVALQAPIHDVPAPGPNDGAVNIDPPTAVEASAPAATNTPRAGESAEPAKRTRKKKDDAPATQQSISTGEERVGPEDDQATAEQDKADEKAEAEASRPADKAYTVDDVKNAFGLYIQKFGMDAVKEDGVNILADALADEKLPAGENFWKASIIPEARYADVIKAFETAASADQRYKRKGA